MQKIEKTEQILEEIEHFLADTATEDRPANEKQRAS
jgi:hypothetical protein